MVKYIITRFEYIADEPNHSGMTVIGVYDDVESAKEAMMSDARGIMEKEQREYDEDRGDDDPEIVYYVVPRGDRLVVVGIDKEKNINDCYELEDYTSSRDGDKIIYEIHCNV